MNILNKLNQADRNRIEKELKEKYRILYEAMMEQLKLYAEAEDPESQDMFFLQHSAFCNQIKGMKIVFDILGIDYSGWEQNIS